MTDTIFFRLLDGVNRPSRLSDAVEELHERGKTADAYLAEPSSLRQVPTSPFAYWVSEEVRAKFTKLPPFENERRKVKQGLATADDFRFVRAWWEISQHNEARSREGTLQGKRWVPFAKGGEYSPYYADVYLVVNWHNDGQELRNFERAYIRNEDFYFRPGITWPKLPHKRGSFRVLPGGCIFSHGGMGIFAPDEQLSSLTSLLNSGAYLGLIGLLMPRGTFGGQTLKFEVGYVVSVPIPLSAGDNIERLTKLAESCTSISHRIDCVSEPSHAFTMPALLDAQGGSLTTRLTTWKFKVTEAKVELARKQAEIDNISYGLYGIEGEDRRVLEASLNTDAVTADSLEDGNLEELENAEDEATILDGGTLVADLLSYTVGCAFGRWDARIALDPSLAPKLADPFAPLPVCSPGMLVGPDGLPAEKDGIASEDWMRARPDAITPPPDGFVQNPTVPDSKYPLAVDWDGILIDDPEHQDDILRRVRGVLELLWGERADAIEGEACDLLGIKDLRTYFRNPRQFFEHHMKRYSKSRRKAPIYWLLQSPKKNYGLWLYYHRLDPDILFKALTNYLEPKIRLEESQLEDFEARRKSAGTAGREARQAERDVAKQEELLADLREFRDRLDRAARLHLRPDLNDGVALNTAPLHELMPQPWKEAKGKWNELLAGKYEWSSIGKQLREKGMV